MKTTVKLGRKTLSKTQINSIKNLKGMGLRLCDVKLITGLSVPTICKYLKA